MGQYIGMEAIPVIILWQVQVLRLVSQFDVNLALSLL